MCRILLGKGGQVHFEEPRATHKPSETKSAPPFVLYRHWFSSLLRCVEFILKARTKYSVFLEDLTAVQRMNLETPKMRKPARRLFQ